MKVLIIGFGAAGQRHAKQLREIYGQKLEIDVYTRKKSPKLIQNDLQSELIESAITHYDAVELSELDPKKIVKYSFAVISTPAESHFYYASLVLSHYVPCFVEKPLALSYSEGVKLREFAQQQKTCLYVGYQLSLHPMTQIFEKYSSKEFLGEINSLSLYYCEKIEVMQPFRKNSENHEFSLKLSGGITFSLSHDLFFLLRFIKNIKVQSVVKNRFSELDDDASTSSLVAHLVGEFDSHEISILLNFDFLTWPPKHSGNLLGSLGTLEWDWVGQEARINSMTFGVEFWEFSDFLRSRNQEIQLKFFLDNINNEAVWGENLQISVDLLKLAETLENFKD